MSIDQLQSSFLDHFVLMNIMTSVGLFHIYTDCCPESTAIETIHHVIQGNNQCNIHGHVWLSTNPRLELQTHPLPIPYEDLFDKWAMGINTD